METVENTAKPGAQALAGPKDTIARNRTARIAPAEEFPSLPQGYQPTPADVRKRRLRSMPRTMIAEGLRALREIGGRGAQVQADLGEFAPDTAPALPLAARIESIETVVQRQEQVLDAYHELEDIALTDAVELLEAVREEFDHRVKKMPELAMRYPMLAAYFQARSSAITDGIARARRNTANAEATG